MSYRHPFVICYIYIYPSLSKQRINIDKLVSYCVGHGPWIVLKITLRDLISCLTLNPPTLFYEVLMRFRSAFSRQQQFGLGWPRDVTTDRPPLRITGAADETRPIQRKSTYLRRCVLCKARRLMITSLLNMRLPCKPLSGWPFTETIQSNCKQFRPA